MIYLWEEIKFFVKISALLVLIMLAAIFEGGDKMPDWAWLRKINGGK